MSPEVTENQPETDPKLTQNWLEIAKKIKKLKWLSIKRVLEKKFKTWVCTLTRFLSVRLDAIIVTLFSL